MTRAMHRRVVRIRNSAWVKLAIGVALLCAAHGIWGLR